ncbi:MAG TPA: hypothetical protein VE984_02275 [Gaiellaceae bacterium]|nr:hypothetical protein [Gaiellaceae bacterium]
MSAVALASARARVRRHVTLETAVRPHTLLLVGAALSLLAWAIPWGSAMPAALRGFGHPEPWTLHGTLFLVGWYAFFFLVAFGGFQLGRRIPVFGRAERVPWQSYYVFLSLVGLLGVAYAYGYVFAKSPHTISAAFLHHELNDIRKVLPYSSGPQTLRYATSLAGGIAVFELGRRRFRVIHVANVVLLLLAAAIASRVSLIIAAIVVAGLAARRSTAVRTRARKVVAVVLLGLVALFLVLSLLNYSRNADFYRGHGVRDPLVMNVYEMVRYVGIPFQAALAVSNHVPTWPAAPASAAAGARAFLLPTYLDKNVPESVSRGETRYTKIVSIPASQTTNSVLAMTYGVFGALAFAVLGFAVLVAGVVAGHASRYRSCVFLGGLVVAYCLAEWWRTYVLNQGIVQFLILVLAFWGVVGASVDDWSGGRWSRFTRFLVPEARLRESRPAPRQT